ncbi:MAG: outer membrane beta-barrel protein [Saprospiraceae bacterium]
MEDFLKQFRENLENRPEPNFEERDWQDMQARLERAGLKGAPIFPFWWLALPFLLLLLGSNTFFFWQWQKAKQQVLTMEIRHDTVFQTRVVYTTDTIYRTRVVRERMVEYQTSFAGIQADMIGRKSDLKDLAVTPSKLTGYLQVPENLQLTDPDSLGNKPSGSLFEDRLSEISELKTETEQRTQNIATLPLGEIQPLRSPRRPVKLPYCEVFTPDKKHKRSFSDHLYAALPKEYHLGVSSGLAYPFGRGVDFKSGYFIGGHGALEFSPNLRLWANVAYFKTLFLTDRMGDDIGVPPEAPPSSDYVFLQAEVPQPFVQYSAGMQYLFRSKHRLKPYVGLGMGAISLLTYDVIYEFKNSTLGVEWNLDVPIHQKGLISNFLVLPAGLEYRFSTQWNAQIQATYRYNWKESGVRSPDMLGIQGGLNYRF